MDATAPRAKASRFTSRPRQHADLRLQIRQPDGSCLYRLGDRHRDRRHSLRNRLAHRITDDHRRSARHGERVAGPWEQHRTRRTWRYSPPSPLIGLCRSSTERSRWWMRPHAYARLARGGQHFVKVCIPIGSRRPASRTGEWPLSETFEILRNDHRGSTPAVTGRTAEQGGEQHGCFRETYRPKRTLIGVIFNLAWPRTKRLPTPLLALCPQNRPSAPRLPAFLKLTSDVFRAAPLG